MSVLIIAEAGVNHNGDMRLANQLIDVAAEAGADMVKFQTFRADALVAPHAPKAAYQARTTDPRESQYEMILRLELDQEMHRTLIARCQRQGIKFLSTGFDLESIDMLVELGVDLFKIPSGEITNLPYLRHAGAFGFPIILSTGMATMNEVGDAISILEKAGTAREQITVLHCTTEYPTPMVDVNLRSMLAIRDKFGVRVGYSDHTPGIEVAIAATAMGAEIIEKHFTLDRTLPGPDHAASLEPPELTAMISAIRNIEVALGDGVKRPSPVEEENKRVVRKSIVARRPIRIGEPFSEQNLATKRPGTGLSPMLWDSLVGRAATRDYVTDELIDQ